MPNAKRLVKYCCLYMKRKSYVARMHSYVHTLQEKFEEAGLLNKRVLAIRAATFGVDHVCYAHALNTRGTLLCKNVRSTNLCRVVTKPSSVNRDDSI